MTERQLQARSGTANGETADPPDESADRLWFRVLAWLLTPIVAIVETASAALRAWADWGTRQLSRLDPLFARFTRLMIHLGSWARPALDWAGRVSDSLSRRLSPLIASAAQLVREITARLQRLAQPIANTYRAARRVARAAVRRASRQVRRLVDPPLAAATRLLKHARAWFRSLRRRSQ